MFGSGWCTVLKRCTIEICFHPFSTSGEKPRQDRQVRTEPPLLTACMAPMTCEILIVDCCSCTSRNVFLHFYSKYIPVSLSKQADRKEWIAFCMPQKNYSVFIWLVVPTQNNLSPAGYRQIWNHQPTICPMWLDDFPHIFPLKNGVSKASVIRNPEPRRICHNFACESANPHADTPAKTRIWRPCRSCLDWMGPKREVSCRATKISYNWHAEICIWYHMIVYVHISVVKNN